MLSGPSRAFLTACAFRLSGTTHTYAGTYNGDAWSFAGGTNYNDASGTVDDAVAKATATVTLGNLSQTYNGTPRYATATTNPPGLTVNLTYDGSPTAPTNASSYAVVGTVSDGNYQGSASGTLVIGKATPTITWANPAAITYGTALGAGQLNASTGIAGSFAYSPGDGTVLDAGNGQTLSVTFTPNDTVNYESASKSVTINVNPAPLTITASNATKVFDAPNPSFTATYSGFVLNQPSSVLTGTLNCTTTATTASPVGSYPITCSGQSSNNYAITYVAGTLKVVYALAGGVCYGDAGHSILQPINVDGTSVFKQGSTVPNKFRVCDVNGVSIGIPGVVTSFNITGIIAGTLQTVNETVASTTPDATFRWDSTAQQWIFNTSTKGMNRNQTYIFTIGLNDGSTIMFQYGLR